MGIIKKLNTLGIEVKQRWPNINNGGCCVYASMIVAALKKNKIPAVGIVTGYGAGRKGPDIDQIRDNISIHTVGEWERNGVHLNHVAVEFKSGLFKRHYDTDGVTIARKEFSDMPIYNGRLSGKELRKLASKKDGWNSVFNRKDIPAIRKLVKKHLCVD